MRKAESYAEQIKYFISEMKDERMKLIEKQRILQLKEQDILHFIENDDKIGGVKGYKYTKKLHEIRKERREVKNELAGFAYFKKYLDDEARMNKVAENLHNGIAKNLSVVYKPRILTEKDVL